MHLFEAHHQWQTRPSDERFWTLQDAFASTKGYADAAIEKPVHYGDLRVEALDGDLRLLGRSRVPAEITHHAFGQIAGRAGAPAQYLRALPATLAAQNLNYGLKTRGESAPDDKGVALFHRGEDDRVLLRAMTSDTYARVWNHELFSRLLDLEGRGWRLPPARPAPGHDAVARRATPADVLRSSRIVGGAKVEVGDLVAPAGCYASDHDMFAFLVNEEQRVDDGSPEGLCRGFFVWNSEVGKTSIGVLKFLYQQVCGNHIVWGASQVEEIRLRHVGDRAKLGARLRAEIKTYADASVSDEQAIVSRARALVLGATKEEVLDALLGAAKSKRVDVPRATLLQAGTLAETRVDDYGDPRTAWAQVAALTEIAQQTTHADARVEADRQAGKLLRALVF